MEKLSVEQVAELYDACQIYTRDEIMSKYAVDLSKYTTFHIDVGFKNESNYTETGIIYRKHADRISELFERGVLSKCMHQYYYLTDDDIEMRDTTIAEYNMYCGKMGLQVDGYILTKDPTHPLALKGEDYLDDILLGGREDCLYTDDDDVMYH